MKGQISSNHILSFTSHHNICNFFGIKKDKFSFGDLESFMVNLSKIYLSLVFYYMMLLMIVFLWGCSFFLFFFVVWTQYVFFLMLTTLGPKYNSWFNFFLLNWYDLIRIKVSKPLSSLYSIGTCFKPYNIFFNLYILFLNHFSINSRGCSPYITSHSSSFEKYWFQLFWAIRESTNIVVSYLATNRNPSS